VSILDFIFPKYCVNCRKIGSYLCPNCFSFLSFVTGEKCAVCNKASIGGLTHPGCCRKYTIDGIFSSIEYKGTAKRLIYNFKYKPYLADLKEVLVDLLFEGIIQKEAFSKIYHNKSFDPKFIVAIPLHKSKFKKRGYNQSEILARALCGKLNLEYLDCVERIKNTHSQVGLSEEKRHENIAGAFEVKKGMEKYLKGAAVFLVDDIFTTGSTLLESANILKRKGAAKVWGITLAAQ